MASGKFSGYSEEPAVVLHNIPPNYSKDMVIDYVESVLDIDVKEVKLLSFLPGKALVYLKETLKDFADAKARISEESLESKKIKLLEANRETAVVVINLDLHKLSEEFLCLYFESEFADGRIIIESSNVWPEFNLATVHFTPSQKAVVERILKQTDLVPLPSENYHIHVYPFYRSFHGHIGEQSADEVIKTTTKGIASGSDDDDDDDDIEKDGVEKSEEETEEENSEEEKRPGKKKYSSSKSSSEEGDTEEEDLGSVSRFHKKEKNSLISSSSRGPSTFRGGFRGRGIGRKTPELVTSSDTREIGSAASKRGSYAQRGGRGDVSAGVGRGDGRNTFSAEKDSSDEDSFHFLNAASRNMNRKSKDGITQSKASIRGRGGCVYPLINRGESIQTNGNQSQKYNFNRQGRDNLTYMPLTCDSHPDFSQQSTEFENKIDVKVDQNLPEQDAAFKKENQEKITYEIAAKDAKIKELEEALARKIKEPENCHEEIDMTVWQYEFLNDCFGHFEKCHIYFEQHKNLAVLEGDSESVKKHNLTLLKELKKLKEYLLPLTPSMHYILSKDTGRKFLQDMIPPQLSGAKTFLQDKSLLIAAKEDSILNNARDFLKTLLDYKETIKLDAKIPLEKIQILQSKLESELLVKVSLNESGGKIIVEGVRDDVYAANREVQTLIEEFGASEKVFKVTGSDAKLLENFRDEIRDCLKGVEDSDMVDTETQLVINLKGDRRAVQQAYRKLMELKAKVTSKSWDLGSEFKNPVDLMLITKGFTSEKMHKKIKNFQSKNKCLIVPHLPDSKTFRICTPKTKKSSPSRHSSASRHKSQYVKASSPKTQAKLNFSVTGTCKLVVKPYGDITKESSDVLVSVLDQRVDLRRTRIGQAFNKTCPNLWKILQVEHESHPDDAVLITKGKFDPIKCQAICHIILTPWNPSLSSTQLSNAIQTVISQAVALGAKSVSFPVLGYGRAFRFPASEVAKIALTSVRSSNLGNTIQKIVLLAPDTDLFTEFKKEAPNHFTAALNQVQGAVGGAPPPVMVTYDESDDESEESDDDDSNNQGAVVEVVSHDSKESSKAEVSIATLHGRNLESMWSEFKKEMIKICLHTDYFNQDIADYWPRESREHILQEAKKLNVWVERSPHPKSKKPGYKVKGEKPSVETMLTTIKDEFSQFSAYIPKRRIKTEQAPRRGTVEFLKHAADSDEIVPTYWNLNRPKKEGMWDRFKGVFTSKKSEKSSYLVSVDSQTKDAIKKLVEKTWDPNAVGAGNDAVGLSHRGIRVTDVKRVENIHQFELYAAQRKSLFKRMSAAGHICPDIGKLPGSKGRVATTELLEKFMKEELYYEINEHYVFHGTKSPDAIIANGMDPKVSSEGGMFGKGTYGAEKFTKSDQYTDPRNHRSPPGTELKMVLARILLGNVFLCDDKHKSVSSKNSVKLVRPPCMLCLEDKCDCKNQILFDSVMGDGKWIFREFVVYDKDRCYPEYLITYQRI